MVALNDNGDGTTAVTQLLSYLSTHPAPTMVSAGKEGGDSAALIPVLAKKNVFAMSLNDGTYQCATNSQVNCPNEFTESDPGSTDMAPVAALFKAKGIKKVGILEEQIDFTETETPAIEQALKAEGIQYVVQTFPATAIDLTPEMSALRSAGAQGASLRPSSPRRATRSRHERSWAGTCRSCST